MQSNLHDFRAVDTDRVVVVDTFYIVILWTPTVLKFVLPLITLNTMDKYL